MTHLSVSLPTVFIPTCSPELISTSKTLKTSCCLGTDLMVTSSLTTRVCLHFDKTQSGIVSSALAMNVAMHHNLYCYIKCK